MEPSCCMDIYIIQWRKPCFRSTWRSSTKTGLLHQESHPVQLTTWGCVCGTIRRYPWTRFWIGRKQNRYANPRRFCLSGRQEFCRPFQKRNRSEFKFSTNSAYYRRAEKPRLISSCSSNMTIVKVYWEPETPSTQHRRLSPASHARRAGTECKARSIVYARSIAHDESREH